MNMQHSQIGGQFGNDHNSSTMTASTHQSVAGIEQFSFIGDLAARLGVSPVTIRFYEKEGLLSPGRIGRFRTFRAEDVAKLNSIIEMRNMGFPISLIRETLALFDSAEPSKHSVGYESILAGHLKDLQTQATLLDKEIEATCRKIQNIEGTNACGDIASGEMSASALEETTAA